MNWWHLGGMNPKFKDFIEKHPNKTMIGVTWALYWRLMVLILFVELFFLIAFLVLASVM